jgi:pSer/pThr/pTyr-binding forkhead associated (FHA) protein
MFALEIHFKDGVSPPETILIRRLQALIGATDYAHVVVDDLKSLDVQLRLTRDIGRKFRCKPIGGNQQLSQLLEGVYHGEAALDLGPVKFYFTAIDSDLLLRESEPPDKAGVRVLRQACSRTSPQFPAVIVGGASPAVVSFMPEYPVYIGRAKQCVLRLDSADISAKHARLGYESGEFWIEDLGSTNGTFVNNQQISGRTNVAAGMPIVVGRDLTLVGVISQAQLDNVLKGGTVAQVAPRAERRYPILISTSDKARPAKRVLHPGSTVAIGRDQSNDICIGAPHVSRRHCTITMSPAGAISVSDYSTNGTAYDRGMLRRGDILEIGEQPSVFDFGDGITVGVCFNEEQEERYVASLGALATFLEEQQQGTRRGAERDVGDESEEPMQRNKPALLWGQKAESRSGVNKFMDFYRTLRPTGKASIVLFALTALLVAAIVVGILSSFLNS